MAKKVLILSGSPRKNGNSDLLCNEFMRGALESGNEVTKIRVAEKKIAPCMGCYYCTKNNGACAIKDDMADVLQQIIDADVMYWQVLFTSIQFLHSSKRLSTEPLLVGWKLRIKNFTTSLLALKQNRKLWKQLSPASMVTLIA